MPQYTLRHVFAARKLALLANKLLGGSSIVVGNLHLTCGVHYTLIDTKRVALLLSPYLPELTQPALDILLVNAWQKRTERKENAATGTIEEERSLKMRQTGVARYLETRSKYPLLTADLKTRLAIYRVWVQRPQVRRLP